MGAALATLCCGVAGPRARPITSPPEQAPTPEAATEAGELELGSSRELLEVSLEVPWLPKNQHLRVVAGTQVSDLVVSVAHLLDQPVATIDHLRLVQDTGNRRLQPSDIIGQLAIPAGSPLVLFVVMNKVPDQYVGCLAPWASRVALPPEMRQLGARIPRTELRAMKLSQLTALGEVLEQAFATWEVRDDRRKDARVLLKAAPGSQDVDANMYNICTHVVMPLTKPFCCSFVELVAPTEQPPHCFVSHFWGNPFWQTLRLLKYHAAVRDWPPDTAYWICTFANNQHDLGDLRGSLEDTPFVKAMRLEGCRGTVVLLDSQVTTFNRIWCVLENHVSTDATSKAAGKAYDLAAWLQEGQQVNASGEPCPEQATAQLDLGNGRQQEWVECNATFPAKVCLRAMEVDLFRAQASCEEDRRAILHFVAQTPPERWCEEPPAKHPNYEALNAHTHRRFLGSAGFQLAKMGNVKGLRALLERYPDAIHAQGPKNSVPLIGAALGNQVECIKILLAARSDIHATNEHDLTAAGLARVAGKTEALELMLEAGADPVRVESDRRKMSVVTAQHGNRCASCYCTPRASIKVVEAVPQESACTRSLPATETQDCDGEQSLDDILCDIIEVPSDIVP